MTEEADGMEPPRYGERVMMAIQEGDRQGLETTLHGLTRAQARQVLHFTQVYKPKELLSPLMATIKYRRIHMLTYLLRLYQLDTEQRGTVFVKFSTRNYLYEKFIEPGATALFMAAAEDQIQYVQLLVETFHADVNAPTERKNTPLHMACIHGNLEMMTYLLKHGANPNAKSDCDDITPLLCILPAGLTNRISAMIYSTDYTGIDKKVKVLIEHGADINARTKHAESTLLHHVAETGELELYKYLVAKGAEVVVDKYELIPMYCACLAGRTDIYKYICSQPGATDQDRLTGMELIFVHLAMEDPMSCYVKLVELFDTRKKLGKKALRAPHSTDSVWLNDYKPNKTVCTKASIWKESLLIIARIFGTDSLQFANRLFQAGSYPEIWKQRDNTVIMRSALSELCVKHKVPSTFLPIYVTMQVMRHLENQGTCYQHNFSNTLSITEMILTVLEDAYVNPIPMINGRTANFIETNSFFKAAMDCIALLIAHKLNVNDPRFKRLVEGIVKIGDKLTAVRHSECSFFQWVIDHPRLSGPSAYSPAKLYEVLFYIVQLKPDLTVYDYRGDTALHTLALYNTQYSDDQFKFLFENFKASNMHLDLVNVDGETAIELCAQSNPDRLHYFTQEANAQIRLKCLAATAVKHFIPNYPQSLPKHLEEFVDTH